MKNIKAFLTAFLLFLVTAAGIHLVAGRGAVEYNVRMGTWMEPSKFACTNALASLLKDENAIAVFGSSELRHGQNTQFGGNVIFKGSDMEPVYIGQAGYQSLTHAIMAGALGENLRGKKAVIIVSPQWFKDGGVKESAFLSAFSEDAFLTFLQNKNIGKEMKQYVTKRAKELACDHTALLDKIETDARLYGEKETGVGILHEFAVKERTGVQLFLKAFAKGLLFEEKDSGGEIDWEELMRAAKERGKEIASGNAFGMVDDVYEKQYREQIESGEGKKPAYCEDSVEFKDLECFLRVCGENGMKTLVIMLPFNGYWYDFLDFERDEREALYEKTKKLVKKYGAAYADLSENEYAQYYFEDNSHPALKGLVDMNEQIYRFYKEMQE